jgi:hypothetical protein
VQGGVVGQDEQRVGPRARQARERRVQLRGPAHLDAGEVDPERGRGGDRVGPQGPAHRFVPGWATLRTKPWPSGSATLAMTIGMRLVARCTARGEPVQPVTIASRFRAARSRAWPAPAPALHGRARRAASARDSPLAQIDRSNVGRLRVAWRWPSPDHDVMAQNRIWT